MLVDIDIILLFYVKRAVFIFIGLHFKLEIDVYDV